MMTTYVIRTRRGNLTATERDRFAQLDGERVPAAELTTAHTVPGFGRVLGVARVVEEQAA